MKLIDQSAFKYLSVKLPALGAFLLLVIVPALQWAVDFQIIPQEYHADITGVVMVILTFIGKKIYQPELHQIQSFATVPSAEDNLKNLFSNFRKIAGGSLSQSQVDQINALINAFKPNTAGNETMKVSQFGIDLICGFEGLRLNAYDDGVGVWTIGYGTTIYPNGIKVKRGDTCTLQQAKDYMAHDLKRFERAVSENVKVSLNQNQFDALVSLTYNIGIGAFGKSTLLKKLNSGDYKGVSGQFDVWNKAGGLVMQGLVNRRALERKLFEKAV